MIDITQKWPVQLKEKRGLLNGKRVQMAYEVRGQARYQLARKIGIPAKELARREQGQCFWTEEEQENLLRATDFPLSFFTQDDPMEFTGPVFFCGTDEDGHAHCHIEQRGEKP